jgi:hypothetical protein
MNTKSAVTPRKIQRTVLNLDRLELGASGVQVAIIPSQIIRRDEGLGETEGCEKLHYS